MTDSEPLRILLDQGVPADAAELLRAAGCDCLHVSELGMQRSEDEEIISTAIEQERLIVTLDSDFHMVIFLERSTLSLILDCGVDLDMAR